MRSGSRLCRRRRLRNFCLSRWRWEWSITGRRRLPESSKIRPDGTWGREASTADSIRFSFRVRCIAWPAICTRFLCQRRGQVRAAPALVEVAAVAGSRAEDLAVGAAAHFEGFLRNPRASTASTTAGPLARVDSALYAALKRRSSTVAASQTCVANLHQLEGRLQ